MSIQLPAFAIAPGAFSPPWPLLAALWFAATGETPPADEPAKVTNMFLLYVDDNASILPAVITESWTDVLITLSIFWTTILAPNAAPEDSGWTVSSVCWVKLPLKATAVIWSFVSLVSANTTLPSSSINSSPSVAISDPFWVNCTFALPEFILTFCAFNSVLFLIEEDVVPCIPCEDTAPFIPNVSALPPGDSIFKYDCSAAVLILISPVSAFIFELSTVIRALFVKSWTRTAPPIPVPESWFHLLNCCFAKPFISESKPS